MSGSIKKAYREFLNTPQGTEIYREFKRLLYAREDSLVQWLNVAILLKLSSAQGLNVRVCDIGGGDGDRITRILQFLHGKFRSKFQLDLVEQSGFYVASFDPSPIANFCRVKVHHKLFEQTQLPKRHFDLVLLIHSIFAFDNGFSTDLVLSLPKENGTIIVVSNSPNSFLGNLKRMVDCGYSDKRFEIDDLVRRLKKLNVPYNLSRFSTRWVFEKRSWKRDTDILLNWISLGRYFTLKGAQQKRIQDFIKARCDFKGGRGFFTEEEVVLIIPSPKKQPHEPKLF